MVGFTRACSYNGKGFRGYFYMRLGGKYLFPSRQHCSRKKSMILRFTRSRQIRKSPLNLTFVRVEKIKKILRMLFNLEPNTLKSRRRNIFFFIFHFSNTFVCFFDFFFSLLRWFWKWNDNLRFLHLQFSSITFRFYFCGAQILGILIREEKMK